MRKIKLFSLFVALSCALCSWAGDVLPGAFSVNNSGRKVYFTRGNAQFSATGTHKAADGTMADGTWRIAANQYDRIGDAAGNNTPYAQRSTQSDWIDLFCFGTSGWPNPAYVSHPEFYARQPWDCRVNQSGPSYDEIYAVNGLGLDCNLTGDLANADWGVYNFPGKNYRVLTQDEWWYVLYARSDASSKLGLGTVNGVQGLILLPDDWAGSAIVAPTEYGKDQYSTNVYNLSQWAIMESEGAVFLPAAGYRVNSEVVVKHVEDPYHAGSGPYVYTTYYGFYASSVSTAFLQSTFFFCDTYNYNGIIVNDFMSYQNYMPKDYGVAVRLVTETVPPPEVSENSDDIEDVIENWATNNITRVMVNRTFYKDGYFNTLCLPFDFTADQIASSELAGCSLYVFTKAEVEIDEETNEQILRQEVTPTHAIEAGIPYLISWPNTGEVVQGMIFSDVNVQNIRGYEVGEEGGVKFVGHIPQEHIDDAEGHSNLFLGANNTLYWPLDNGSKMMGFRAYFKVPTGGANNAPMFRGMAAKIVVRENAPTDVEQVSSHQVQSTKVLRDGQLFIIRGEKEYNAQGQIVK